MAECPGCGAEIGYSGKGVGTVGYDCGSWFVAGKCAIQWSKDCLHRQLAQRDERIGELEAERDQLRADLAALEARAMQLEEALKDVIQADIARQHGVPISVVDIAGKALEG